MTKSIMRYPFGTFNPEFKHILNLIRTWAHFPTNFSVPRRSSWKVLPERRIVREIDLFTRRTFFTVHHYLSEHPLILERDRVTIRAIIPINDMVTVHVASVDGSPFFEVWHGGLETTSPCAGIDPVTVVFIRAGGAVFYLDSRTLAGRPARRPLRTCHTKIPGMPRAE